MSWSGVDPWKSSLRAERLSVSEYEAPCQECGQWFTTHRAERLYCSTTCRVRVWRRSHPVAKHLAPEFCA
jgi:hypothetical protein